MKSTRIPLPRTTIRLRFWLPAPVVLLLAFCLLPSTSIALTALEIIERSEMAVRGNTQIAVAEMTVKTRRWTRTMEMISYTDRLAKKTFSEIRAPKKDAGNRFLLLEQKMWHYVPKLQQTIKISPSMMLQSWMGSDFTNDDIVRESSILNDYTHRILGEETVDGHPCFKIELIPKPDAAVVWGKIIYYARESDLLPVREEFYNERNVLKRFMTFSDYAAMHDRVIPTLYTMKTVKKPHQYTVMRIKTAQFNVPIAANVFSLQHLKRR